MKRIVTFLMMAWSILSMSHAQDFIVYSVANTVKLAEGKSTRPISQGQKLNIKTKVYFSANATLDLINVDTRKRYILNVKNGFYPLEKLINKSNGIDLSINYLRYLMKQLLTKTPSTNDDGDTIGGSYRDSQEDMFDIQDWLDKDSIDNMKIPDVNIQQ